MLVVFFLSLCALMALGSYAITIKLVQERIAKQGGDLVFAMVAATPGANSTIPTERELEEVLDVDAHVLRSVGMASEGTRRTMGVFTYDFQSSATYLPLLAPSGGPTFLMKDEPASLPAGPATVTLNRTSCDVFVRRLPENHPVLRAMGGSGILLQPDSPVLANLRERPPVYYVLMRVRHVEGSLSIMRVEQYLRNYMKLDGWSGSTVSAAALLAEMDVVLDKQEQCRLGFCVGICCIVGILLTALAGMEYRQNEYVYTLMKSFGIHPIMLVGAFLVENLLLVGASFVAALAVFMRFQNYIVTEVLKQGQVALTLEEIMPEIRVISYSLAACVLVSSLPIVVAANRAIGRVLK